MKLYVYHLNNLLQVERLTKTHLGHRAFVMAMDTLKKCDPILYLTHRQYNRLDIFFRWRYNES